MDGVEAYKIVCSKDNPYRSYEILNSLEREGLDISRRNFKGLLPTEYCDITNKLVQQILLRSARRRIMQPLIKSCAGNTEPQAFPLPEQWLRVLEYEGVKVNKLGSRTTFLKEQGRAWVRSLKGISVNIRCGLKSYDIDSAYVIYPDLSENCCVDDGERRNFIHWLKNHNEYQAEKIFCVTSKNDFEAQGIKRCPFIFPRLNKAGLISFISRCLFYLYPLALMKWIAGNWAIPFILPEIIAYEYFKRINVTADRYAFNNSSHALRPLWTYAAEKLGSEIILYFYSGNTNVFYKGQKKPSPPTPGYISMTWPKYWVIDEEQERFLTQQCSIKSDIKIKGYIDFADSGTTIPHTDKPVIAMFDIPVYNIEHSASHGVIAPYYLYEIVEKFVDDIVNAAKKNGFHIYWKTKRNMSGNPNISTYNKLVRKYEDDRAVIFIDPDVSAKRLMNYVDVGIAMPFTSALLASDAREKHLYFYDPISCLSYFSGLNRGITVLKGVTDLNKALSELMIEIRRSKQ